MFALNQGEVCTCPSRALVQESVYDRFMERAVARTKKIKQGHPLDAATMIGAQASNDQLEKILSYFDIGKQEVEYWRHTQLIIDVVPGRGSGFSVEAPEGVRFLTRSRVFTDQESGRTGGSRTAVARCLTGRMRINTSSIAELAG